MIPFYLMLNDAVLGYGGNSVTLLDVSVDSLDAADFLFL